MNLNPLTWSLAGKAAAVAVLVGGLSGSIVWANMGGPAPSTAVSAPSPSYSPAGEEPGVSTYVCTGTGNDLLLQWQESNGALNGTYEHAQLTGTAPQEQVTSNQGDLTGTLNGDAVTMQIGLSQPLYGNLNGGTLTLNVPQQDGSIQASSCDSSDLNRWNQAIAGLNSQAGNDNTTVQQQQAQAQRAQQISNTQQALAEDVPRLSSDAATLNNDTSLGGDIQQMQKDYGQEQHDWQAEQADSCSNLGSDSATVSSDNASASGDNASEQGDVTGIQNSISSVTGDMKAVQGDLSTLQGLNVSPSTDSSAAMAAGSKAVSDAGNAISWANGQANSVNNAGTQLAATAGNYANAHGC